MKLKIKNTINNTEIEIDALEYGNDYIVVPAGKGINIMHFSSEYVIEEVLNEQ